MAPLDDESEFTPERPPIPVCRATNCTWWRTGYRRPRMDTCPGVD
ncbi:hypothetical protein I548_0463 [Mycobacterium intracellulare]|nr:hypothetical protein L842_3828 [Mycobacterium intracellulare MIN_052511_1280]EUA31694.1 hypothetical protein I548_0463 [Mycobacterium intracellulare]